MTKQPARRTEAELDALKESWLIDPCYDLEEAEGFEAHREELAAYAKQARETWADELKEQRRMAISNIHMRFDHFGEVSSHRLAEYAYDLEQRLERLEATVAALKEAAEA